MATSTPEVNFSDLSRSGGEVVDKVHNSPTRTVRVRRRDAADDDLVLMTEARARDEHEVMSATTRMFVAMIQQSERARDLLTDVAPKAFPWVRFLPRDDVQAFVVELVNTLDAAEGLDQNPAPILQVINEWRNTAHVHADPELMGYLRADDGEMTHTEARRVRREAIRADGERLMAHLAEHAETRAELDELGTPQADLP